MDDAQKLRTNISHLLKQVGLESRCKGCGVGIWWVEHRNGKRAPYTAEALNHFADCPQAQQFRTGRKASPEVP